MNNTNNLKDIDITTVDIQSLVDINDVVIDESKPQKDRVIDFVKQIKNPYCFRCGDIAVKVTFSDNNETLDSQLEKIILCMK